jgi:hypothetical protein
MQICSIENEFFRVINKKKLSSSELTNTQVDVNFVVELATLHRMTSLCYITMQNLLKNGHLIRRCTHICSASYRQKKVYFSL